MKFRFPNLLKLHIKKSHASNGHVKQIFYSLSMVVIHTGTQSIIKLHLIVATNPLKVEK